MPTNPSTVTLWDSELKALHRELSALEVTSLEREQRHDADHGFMLLQGMVEALRRDRKTMYLIGNGASASLASHYSADLAKNTHIHTQVFSDLSLITALSNDFGYDYVFSIPLERRAIEGDMLVAISSSGRSANILKAVEAARHLNVTVITLTAMDKNNPLRNLGNLNFYIPARTYGHAETGHAAILHHLIDRIALSLAEKGALI